MSVDHEMTSGELVPERDYAEGYPRDDRRDLGMDQLPVWVRGHKLATLGKLVEGEYVNEAVPTDRMEDAEVITSWTGERDDVDVKPGQERSWESLINQPETYHRPVLDLDMAAVVIPSTTPGHGHLYIDKVLTWTQYAKLLDVLAEVGIIEEGYRQASYAREFTSVRLPWVAKPKVEVLPDHIEELCATGKVTCHECLAAGDPA